MRPHPKYEKDDEDGYETNNVAAMMAKANATDDPDEAARLMEEATKEGAKQYFLSLIFLVLFIIILLIIVYELLIRGA